MQSSVSWREKTFEGPLILLAKVSPLGLVSTFLTLDPNLPLARVRWRSRQDEANEDSLPVLAAHDVEAEAPALLVEDHLSGLPRIALFDTWSGNKLQGLPQIEISNVNRPKDYFLRGGKIIIIRALAITITPVCNIA